ncbi:MAG TPA: FAD-dependent oxidoreductase, partial [Coriobacteriia bacterium]
VMEPLTDPLYEAKLLYHSAQFSDRVRTFCMNPYGEVTTESYGGITTVNGHSFSEAKTPNTNFAVLVSQAFTEPFDDPITYGESVAQLANLLGEGIIVQRLGDLKAGRRSTPGRMAQSSLEPSLRTATPGDLAFVLPYRHLADLLEFIEALDRMVPGVAAPETLLYGVEVKFYSSRLTVGPDLQTEVAGLYAIGDGAGITRGLVQSSASGVVAARAWMAGQ